MKISSLRQRFSRFSALLRTALTAHPVELLILLHATAAACASVFHVSHVWMHPAAYAPFAVVAALSLSFHRERHRWATIAYWAVLPLYLLTVFLPDAWRSSTEIHYLYTTLPAIYLLARNVKDNSRYSLRFYSLARSLTLALGIATLLMVLLMLILFTVETLFTTALANRLYGIIATLCFSFVAPVVFISLETDRSNPSVSRLEHVVINYILTPALLLYNLILYVYAAIILFRWELPEDSVATMVLVFVAVQLVIDIVRPLLSKQPLAWYFQWFGLIALPLVVLFWVATGYRLSQYGLTIDRCFLLLAGVLMTLYCLLTPFLRTKPWHWITVLAVAGILILTLGGPLSARQLSLYAQLSLIRTNAAQAHILTPEGTIDLNAFHSDPADTLYRNQHRAAYQAMLYIENDLNDTLTLPRQLGIDRAGYLDRLSDQTARHSKASRTDNAWYQWEIHNALQNFSLYNRGEKNDINIKDYNRMFLNSEYYEGTDIPYPGGTLNADTLLAAQLAKIGYTLRSNLDDKKLEQHKEQLLDYTSPDGTIRIVLDELHISKADSLNHISSAHICYALAR